MKKLLSLLMVLGINAFSQTTVYYLNSDASLSTTSPKNVGASSFIGLDYTLNTNDSFLVYVISTSLADNTLDTCSNRVKIGVYKVSQIITWPQYQYGANSAFKLSFNIPNAPTGMYKLKVSGYGNCLMNYSCPNCSTPPMFLIQNTNDVEQYQSTKTDEYFYFEYGSYKIKVNKRTKEKYLQLN